MEARGRCDAVFDDDCGGCERGNGPDRGVGSADVDCCDRSLGSVVEAETDRPASAEGGLLDPIAEGGRRALVLLPNPRGEGWP